MRRKDGVSMLYLMGIYKGQQIFFEATQAQLYDEMAMVLAVNDTEKGQVHVYDVSIGEIENIELEIPAA